MADIAVALQLGQVGPGPVRGNPGFAVGVLDLRHGRLFADKAKRQDAPHAMLRRERGDAPLRLVEERRDIGRVDREWSGRVWGAFDQTNNHAPVGRHQLDNRREQVVVYRASHLIFHVDTSLIAPIVAC